MTAQSFLADFNRYAIVADIGGTNARFSRVDLLTLDVDRMAIYPCADFPSLDKSLAFYQKAHELESIKQVAVAIACPVTNDSIRMTNFHWQFSINELKQQLGLTHLQVLNDFAAIAMSLPVLKPHESIQVGGGSIDPYKSMVVLGAGTGLGISHLIPSNAGFIPLPGEGGHITWAAQTEQEWFIQRFLAKKYGHVSCERLLSGPGLENIYLALASFHKKEMSPLSAAEIANLALSGECKLANATVSQFFASLGSVAGDMALALGAFGGIYIAGGIVPKLFPLMKESEFRNRFEAKGRSSAFNRQIATFVIVAEQPGLIGAAVYLKQTRLKEQYDS